MIIPIRCFTCNEVIAHKWEEYINELQKAYLEENIKYHDIIVGVINIASAIT